MKSKIIPAFLFACLALVYTSSMAQSEDDAKTLFGNGKTLNTENVGLFVAPAFGLTQMDGSAASLFNLRGGLNFDDKLSLGAYFSTSMNQIRPESELVPNVYMDYWTVGAFAEYTLLSKRAFHLTFPLFLGYGEVEMDNNDGELQFGEANFFQIEPSALLEVNLHKYVRFNLGAGYRLVGDMNYRNFDQSDISGVTAYAGLKFGLFQ